MELSSKAWVSRVRWLLTRDAVRFRALADFEPEIVTAYELALSAVTYKEVGPFGYEPLAAIVTCLEYAERQFMDRTWYANRLQKTDAYEYELLTKLSRIKLFTGGM